MSALYDRAENDGADLSNQVPIHCSFLMEDYLKDLWANERRVTKDKRRKVITKQDIKSVLYDRAEHHGAVLSNQVPTTARDPAFYGNLFDEIVKELRQEYHRAVLSYQVPILCKKLDPELSSIRGNSRGTAPRVSRRSSFQSSAYLEQRRNGGLFEGFVGHRTSGDEEKTA
ncbi:hypothetical protein CEXT_63571 [Caerostris extrusa]|uniref:Uncharacterized protein n=1 Tax=Caerostris extrusa TaxID=172846 RepID=A0AAV4MIE9_CAEEX|nr:hypothetical protein CEXT_63571 [Caerostris extrusa]